MPKSGGGFQVAALTHHVTVFDPEGLSIRWVTISAFCRECGQERGAPRLRARRIDSVDTWVHRWDNLCGHIDTNDSILLEVATQCAHRNCALMQSENFYPYCGPGCAIRSLWDAVSHIRATSQALTAPLETLRRLTAIMETCPFREASEDLRQALLESSRAIAKSQDRLTRLSFEVVSEAAIFGDQLDDLVDSADDETREKFPLWTNHKDWYHRRHT